MLFDEKFNDIKSIIKEDLDYLEQGLKKTFTRENPLDKDLSAFLTAPAKRLRPLLGALFLRCVFGEINSKQHDILLSIELIHNATLIHDDVIDKAKKRRTQETLNVKFDDNLAVVAGDYILSVAMEKIIDIGSVEVIKLCTSALKSTCLGEINQYFSKFKITSIDEYIQKSKEKTALLFEISVLSGLFLNEKPIDNNLKQIATEFSQNFGIAFQIRDDLKNVLSLDKLSSHDISSGINTAPVIFAYQENENILHEANIAEIIKTTNGIAKTKDLMDNYFDRAILAIKNLEGNIYKKAILELIELLKISV
ncbi:MAG: polyprenyl synthetase family protein [bacterium]